MAIISGTTVDWTVSPRIITISSAHTEITIDDLQDTLQALEDTEEGIIWPHLRVMTGGEALGGGVSVGLTMELQNAQVAFEARTNELQSGTATTGGTTTLIDTAATFITNGVGRGDLVINYTDSSQATVAQVDSETQLTIAPLTGGTDNDFDISDAYDIYDVVQCRVSGGNLVAVDDLAAEISPIFPTFGTQVLTAASSSSTSQNAASIEYAAFSNGVWVDVINGSPGTGYAATGRPYGTPQDKSNNVPDAVAIQAARGLPKVMFVSGDLTLDTGDDVTGFHIRAHSIAHSHIHIQPGAVVTEAMVHNAHVEGTFDGDFSAIECSIGNTTYFSGIMKECLIEGPITLGGAAQADFISCYSAIAGGSTPTIDFGGSGQSLTLRAYSGGVKIVNKTGSEEVSIDLNSGQVLVDLTTVTNGSLYVRGQGKCVNAADTTDHLLSGTYGGLTLYNETTSGMMLQELWQLQGLDPDAPMTVTKTTRDAGGISQTISGDGLNTSTVTRT